MTPYLLSPLEYLGLVFDKQIPRANGISIQRTSRIWNNFSMFPLIILLRRHFVCVKISKVDKLFVNYNENKCPRPLGPKEIDGLLVPPGTASSPLTDHLITG